jgi:hypothetical protein
LGGVMRSATAGMVQTSPGAHGKLSQDAVAEGRRIAFAVARKGHDALRENFSSSCLSSVRPSLLQTSSRAIEIALMSSGPNASHPKNGPVFIAFSSDTRGVGNKSFSRRQRAPSMERSQLRVTFLCHTRSSGLKSVRIHTNQVCNALVVTGTASRRSAPRNWLVKPRRLGVTGRDPCSHDPRSIKRTGRIELRSYG